MESEPKSEPKPRLLTPRNILRHPLTTVRATVTATRLVTGLYSRVLREWLKNNQA